MFVERADFHDTNRGMADRAIIRPAELADGTIGVVLQYGKFPICFTNEEAIRIATGLADVVGRNRT